MNDLFNDQEPVAIATMKLPRLSKASGKCLADFATESERATAALRMQARSERELQRNRIMAARAELKQAQKKAKLEAKKCK